jgi:MFS family permease
VSRDAPVRLAGFGLAVLTLLNLFNYLDRFVVASIVESLKKSELAPTDAQLGGLASAFLIVYMLTSPLFGVLGDRGSRPRLLAGAVALWSVTTALGGLARSFTGLFASRAAVGVGEAAYGSIAPALLADYFPDRVRGRVYAVFFAAIPVGAAAGYILGGLVDQRWGWRAAFLIAGLPGLLLALLCFALPETRTRDASSAFATSRERPRLAYRSLLRNAAYRRIIAGYAAYTFALGALAFWMPAFLVRARGVPASQATVQFGLIAVGTGFAGTFAGGWLADRLRPRRPEADLLVCGWATLAAAPAALVAFLAPEPAVYLPAIVVAELLLFASTGPVNSATIGAVATSQRASAMALQIFAIHLFGDVPSPPLLGAISDRTSLQTAFLMLPVAILLAGVIWLYAALRDRDPQRRPEQ